MRETGLDWQFKGQHLTMFPQKALYWAEENALIVTDLHIGKVGHFRKSGIAIPRPLEQEDLAVLSDLIHTLKPLKIIFLGDLFHSELNNDWNWLQLWRDLHPAVLMVLVRGNHDILHDRYYKEAGFELHDELNVYPFTFIHEPLKPEDTGTGAYTISGHIHPAVRLRGRGRQSVVLPCFYFGETQAVLPAFGRFTGKCCLNIDKNAKVFGVIKNTVKML